MRTGTYIEAPGGFRILEPGVKYVFLRSDAKSGRVFVVRFFDVKDEDKRGKGKREKTKKKKPAWKKDARIYTVRRDEFEEAIEVGDIVEKGEQQLLPPWLEELNGKNLASIDAGRVNRKSTDLSIIEGRLERLNLALKALDAIFGSPDPERAINAIARRRELKQNETRYRCWLLSYLCSGQNMWSLSPTYHRVGAWDRLESGKKFGRPPKGKNRKSGFGMTEEMVNLCVSGYAELACVGMTMRALYTKVLDKKFKCRTRKIGGKKVETYHPEGRPFPSFDQFRYRILKHVGKQVVHLKLYGRERYRRNKPVEEGGFAESVANLMEKTEIDGYFADELPRGFIEGSTLKRICCVVIRDILSGLKIGIGFSFGAETSAAYRMALFCAAIPKSLFCKLFGMEIDEDEWPSVGALPSTSMDRGPGAAKGLIVEFEKKFAVRELAPSYSAQSKAVVEASHPRSLRKEGQPTYMQSDKTPIKLAQQEIMRLIEFNQVSNADGRIHPHPGMADIEPSPIELWNYFVRRGRNDAMPMSVEDAVMTFLTPTTVTLKSDGVWLEGVQRYSSEELKESEAYWRLRENSSGTVEVGAYILDFCVRYIWIELGDRLMMLEAHLMYRDDDELLDISISDLKTYGERRAEARSDFREKQHSVKLHAAQRFKEMTGSEFDSGKRKTGKKKQDAVSRQENVEARKLSGRRGAA